jgi:hypothetical protein
LLANRQYSCENDIEFPVSFGKHVVAKKDWFAMPDHNKLCEVMKAEAGLSGYGIADVCMISAILFNSWRRP